MNTTAKAMEWLRSQRIHFTAREGQRVRKIGGSFQHTGTVVAEFVTTSGQPRIVLEFDDPVAGMLHVYRPDQVEIMTDG